ncbi:MarR family winged helix-turn-helix transcriptional regulator [Microbacterium sp. kSW2-24]|uniref:MarR family winged helix-turn-helix transcriptional regulator n=1 Tax=Microbacterium galbinum TaxID=2851646 RepID=UPI001FFD8E0D|nr:MarR family winged helix-turn-helix transcriptional regulator [Microbacterium galbinum]MCK2022668.1 MarR family winged helix-turn-helix transcriptional regulator [Microbacterium galbinum]
MERRIADIEYEQMVQSRYAIAQHQPRGGDDLDRSAYLLLSRIHAEGPKTIGELSEIFRLDTSTVQRQTSSAMRAGLIDRAPDPDGGIARVFTLTPDGLAKLIAVRDRSVRALGVILADWSDAEVSTFADMLHRFNTDIEQYTSSRRAPREL